MPSMPGWYTDLNPSIPGQAARPDTAIPLLMGRTVPRVGLATATPSRVGYDALKCRDLSLAHGREGKNLTFRRVPARGEPMRSHRWLAIERSRSVPASSPTRSWARYRRHD